MVKKEITLPNSNNDKGFTLIEVMIAMAIFAIFVTAFMTAQGYNIADSRQLKEEIVLRDLAEQKANELVYNPPEFKEGLTLSSKTGKFKQNEDFTYKVTYKRFELEIEKMLESTDPDTKIPAGTKKVYKNITKNLKEILWQVEVQVKSSISGNTMTVSTWLYNHEAKVLLEAF